MALPSAEPPRTEPGATAPAVNTAGPESPGAFGHGGFNGPLSFRPYHVPLSVHDRHRHEAIVPGLIDAGPSVAGVRRAGSASNVPGFPIQEGKVQRPPLRDATLRRDRLLDWLTAKITRRVVLVTAEAGYGKTTLLADFARRTRVRTLWYRLDDDDGDWATVLHHLIAAGRQVDPAFAPATASLLGGASAPDRDETVRTFIGELSNLASARTALVLDDYHAVDGTPDVRYVVRELLAKAPDRLSFVFLSRRRPSLPFARLRTLGELAELTAADLRFDLAETERLFRDTYGRRLEPDVLADLNRRTEGWAASLQLVHTALRDRTPMEIRTFVRTLTGAQSELHDYLAEEVIGELSPPMRRFLTRTAVLQEVVPDLAAVATGEEAPEIEAHRLEAERLGLLSPRSHSKDGAQRYHPLVRQHLEATLSRDLPSDEIAALHSRLAYYLEPSNWRLAAHHHAAAGDRGALARVLQVSTPTIMGTGDYALAQSYIANLEDLADHPSTDIVLSRLDLRSEQFESATQRAAAANDRMAHEGSGGLALLALENLMAVRFMSGDMEGSMELAQHLGEASDETLRLLGDAQRQLLLASTTGSIDDEVECLTQVLRLAERYGHSHYAGIAALNLAFSAQAQADSSAAIAWAESALDSLGRSSCGPEMASAHSARAWGFAHSYRLAEADSEVRAAIETASGLAKAELLIEGAELHAWYGDAERAAQMLQHAGLTSLGHYAPLWHLTNAQISLRRCNVEAAEWSLGHVRPDAMTTEAGFQVRRRFVEALIALTSNRPDAATYADETARQAESQRIELWRWPAQLLLGLAESSQRANAAIAATIAASPSALSFVAEPLALRLGELDPSSRSAIESEAARRPDRWRMPLRTALEISDRTTKLACARVLEDIGDKSDVARLRSLSRGGRRDRSTSALGRGLARRLADRVFIEDQGRVRITVGDSEIQGTEIRRKVLALLCFLLTRSDLSATRDQVLDALWPDLEPDIAVNSLNQTVYFLRRIFEPDYTEDLSPGYVHHDSDILWLDPELVSSRSRRCRDVLREIGPNPEPVDVARLVELYQGRFALDFAYEEWATAYRDWMHAAYLETVERAIQSDTNAGHWDRAIEVARRAAEVDPEAETVELALLRLYRLTGAHAAAAEQYGHYADMLRTDLGVDPPPLASL